jgi:predicted DNA-binding antitoxin AbrB/MazE fold protein
VHRGNLPSPPSKRRSRFERTKPNNFWWQDRDEEIIAAVYLHGVLSTKQIADLFFGGSVSAATKRLRKLFDAGWLQRAFRPNGVGHPKPSTSLKEGEKRFIASLTGWVGLKRGSDGLGSLSKCSLTTFWK